MEITINRKDHRQFLELNKIRWNLYARKWLIFCFIYISVGGVCMLIAWYPTLTGESFWGFFSTFGFSLFLLATIYFSHYFQNKKLYFLKTNLYIQKLDKQLEGITYKFTEDLVTVKDFESYSETKWTAFTHYKLYKDLLLIMNQSEYFGAVTVDKKELTLEQFSELTSFVSKRLYPK